MIGDLSAMINIQFAMTKRRIQSKNLQWLREWYNLRICSITVALFWMYVWISIDFPRKCLGTSVSYLVRFPYLFRCKNKLIQTKYLLFFVVWVNDVFRKLLVCWCPVFVSFTTQCRLSVCFSDHLVVQVQFTCCNLLYFLMD